MLETFSVQDKDYTVATAIVIIYVIILFELLVFNLFKYGKIGLGSTFTCFLI